MNDKYMKMLDEKVKVRIENASHSLIPFRYWIIDDVLPECIVKDLECEIESVPKETWDSFNYEMQNKSQMSNINLMPRSTRDVISYFNSGTFIQHIEKLTGIGRLISDPYLEGGGLHRLAKGGRLAIHADFSRHNKLKIYRRINLILYLNSNWKSEYRGDLKLIDKDAATVITSISPILNRAVIFETNVDSFHGHPEPLECPDGVYRKSIALYYYTIEKSSEVRGINTRWRIGNSRPARLIIIRKPLSIFVWQFSRLLDYISEKLERLHGKIDSN